MELVNGRKFCLALGSMSLVIFLFMHVISKNSPATDHGYSILSLDIPSWFVISRRDLRLCIQWVQVEH